MSCFSVNIFGYEADKIIRRPHRFLFFIFKLFYLLKCNARHTGFLDFFGIIFQKNGQKTLFLPLYCWLNTSVSFWNIKPLQNQKKMSVFWENEIFVPFSVTGITFWHIRTKASILLLNLGYLTYCDVFLFFLYVWGILSHRYIGLRCIPFSKIHVYRWTTGSFWALWRALHFFLNQIFCVKIAS